jgi:hypothetical protein
MNNPEGGSLTLYARYHGGMDARAGDIKSGGFNDFMTKFANEETIYHGDSGGGVVGGNDVLDIGELDIEITGGLGATHTVKIYGGDGGDDVDSDNDIDNGENGVSNGVGDTIPVAVIEPVGVPARDSESPEFDITGGLTDSDAE